VRGKIFSLSPNFLPPYPYFTQKPLPKEEVSIQLLARRRKMPPRRIKSPTPKRLSALRKYFITFMYLFPQHD
jgi:hypothetical protein